MSSRADQLHSADSTPQPRINETGVPKSQIPLRSLKGTAGNARARIAGGLRFVVVRTAVNNESRAVVIFDHGLDIEQIEKDFGLIDAYGADEAFVTGTFAGLIPVTKIDGRAICGKKGPVTTRLQDLYLDLCEREASSGAHS